MSLLCVAAFLPELIAIEGAKRALGVGLVAASAGATTALFEVRPSEVVMLGTCGAYAGSGLAIGDVVVADEIVLASAAEARDAGALLPMMIEPVRTSEAPRALLRELGARPARVATTLAITTDDALAVSLRARYSCDAEHLEAYAVGAACRAAGVPFTCVLGVTNDVGALGRAQWQEHRVAVERATGELVTRWLARLKNPS